MLYMRLGDYERAAADYTHLIEHNPNNPSHYFNRGSLYYRQFGEYEKAAADFSQAIMLAPSRPYYHRSLGDVYFIMEQQEEALANYRRYLELMGDYPDPTVVERVHSMEHPFLVPGIVSISLLTTVALSVVVWCNRWRFLYQRKRKYFVTG